MRRNSHKKLDSTNSSLTAMPGNKHHHHHHYQQQQQQQQQQPDKSRNYGNNRGCYISLACSIGSIGIACGSLLQLNSYSDRISLQRGLFLTSLGFVHFISLTGFLNTYFLKTRHGVQFRTKYQLMISDVLEITNKIVSAFQAAFSCIAGFIVCKSSCTRSFLHASHYVMEAYAWFGTAYFMYDIWSMYKVHTQKIVDKLKLINNSSTTMMITENYDKMIRNNVDSNGKALTITKCYESNVRILNDNVNDNEEDSKNGLYDKNENSNEENHCFYTNKYDEEMEYFNETFKQLKVDGKWEFFKYILKHPLIVLHHIFIGTFGLLVVTYLRGNFGDCVYSFIYLMEFSTPFVSLRGILSILGLKNTKCYIINGFTMLGTFFICRIIMWPYILHWYSKAINRPLIQAIMGLPIGCKISITILFLPQLYWFLLMVKGAFKVMYSSSCNKKEKNKLKNNNLSPVDGENDDTFLKQNGI